MINLTYQITTKAKQEIFFIFLTKNKNRAKSLSYMGDGNINWQTF